MGCYHIKLKDAEHLVIADSYYKALLFLKEQRKLKLLEIQQKLLSLHY